MGVKINPIVTSQALDYANLKGSLVAVDGPNIVFSLVSFKRKGADGKDKLILDHTQRPISHLYGLLDRVNFLYSKGISKRNHHQVSRVRKARSH